MQRPGRQLGQASTEFVGVVAAGVIVVLLVIAAAPGLGDTVVSGLRSAVCRVVGQGCEAGGTQNAGALPDLRFCVTDASDRKINASVTAFFIKFGGGVEGLKEQRANGDVAVTLKANGEAGLEFKTPGGSADVPGGQVGTPLSAKVSATGTGALGRRWVFHSDKEAQDFIDHVVDKAKAKADLIPDFFQSADDYNLPDEESTIKEGGFRLNASAAANGGGAYANVRGNVAAVQGGRYFSDGSRQIYFKTSGGLSGDAGVLFGGGVAGGVDASRTMGITYDKTGRPVKLMLLGTDQATGGLDLTGKGSDIATTLGSIEKATLNGNATSGGKVEFQAEVDLTQGDNAAIAKAFTDGVDPRTGQPVDSQQAAQDLYSAIDSTGKFNVRRYSVDSSKYSLDASAGIFGFSGSYESTDSKLEQAFYKQRGGGMVPWKQCR